MKFTLNSTWLECISHLSPNDLNVVFAMGFKRHVYSLYLSHDMKVIFTYISSFEINSVLLRTEFNRHNLHTFRHVFHYLQTVYVVSWHMIFTEYVFILVIIPYIVKIWHACIKWDKETISIFICKNIVWLSLISGNT